jgi:hypothetical protein
MADAARLGRAFAVVRAGHGFAHSWASLQWGLRRETEAQSFSRGLTWTAPGGNAVVALIHRQLWPLSCARSGCVALALRWMP